MESCNYDVLNTYVDIDKIAVDNHLIDHNYYIPSKSI